MRGDEQPRYFTRRSLMQRGLALAGAIPAGGAAPVSIDVPSLPDDLMVEAYGKAARRNVLAAVNPRVFPGYWSVCADGEGFGYGNTYPSLDGHQMADALLWLGQVEVAKANWAYVRSFQREDGCLPLAILPAQAGKDIGPAGYPGTVDPNGGLYKHWVPGNPLAALASTTYIQNADVIFRRTLDLGWLRSEIASVNRAGDFLASLTSENGSVKGSGYYIERPARFDCDGVTQPHAVDALRRLARLNRVAGEAAAARCWEGLADRIARNFIKAFWAKDHFAEYLHPDRGLIDAHGLTDTNWAALAFGIVTAEQRSVLWPKLRDETGFYYGGMPTGIATRPETYEAWEFSYPDRMDLAAMGRVWYVECQARARLGDGPGLVDSIRKVCQVGRAGGYYWRERYNQAGGHGARKYCEYPANLIRVIQRFLLGVDLGIDGALRLAPTVPAEFEDRGFGQTLSWRDRTLRYEVRRGRMTGTYSGGSPQRLSVRPSRGGMIDLVLPASGSRSPHRFELGLRG
jgi:hypothetical protein